MTAWKRRDTGATDPLLVIAAIAVSLVLLIGGSFTVTKLLGNAKTANTKQDLDRILTIAAASVANGLEPTKLVWTPLAPSTGPVDTSVSESTTNVLRIKCGGLRVWMARSVTGDWFWRWSDAPSTQQVPTPWPASPPDGFPAACAPLWPGDPETAATAAGGDITMTTALPAGETTVTNGQTMPGHAGQYTRLTVSSTSTDLEGQPLRFSYPSMTTPGTYEVAVPVANDGPTAIWGETDLGDSNSMYFHLNPGEARTIVYRVKALAGSLRWIDVCAQQGSSNLLVGTPTLRTIS